MGEKPEAAMAPNGERPTEVRRIGFRSEHGVRAIGCRESATHPLMPGPGAVRGLRCGSFRAQCRSMMHFSELVPVLPSHHATDADQRGLRQLPTWPCSHAAPVSIPILTCAVTSPGAPSGA